MFPVESIERLQSQSITEQLPGMTADLADLNARIKQAVAHGQLVASSARNIRTLLEGAGSDVYFRSVKELVHATEWQELNDRFYQTLAFGTGGLRGRTIGKIVTTAESGNAREGAMKESGDVLLSGAKIYAEMGEALINKIPPRANETTIFKSLGMAVEDIAVAMLVYRSAMRR